jgi:hypothetical protein
MKISQIIYDYYNKPKEHKREIGRYWASDINSIRGGWLTPSNYFKQKPINKWSQNNIFWGCAGEAELAKIFKEQGIKFETQIKKELQIEDFILVVKPDFITEEFVMETKCPANETKGIPDKWLDQLEAEYQAFKKPVYLGILNKSGDKIINTYLYKPNEERWSEIIKILISFHKRLCKTQK